MNVTRLMRCGCARLLTVKRTIESQKAGLYKRPYDIGDPDYPEVSPVTPPLESEKYGPNDSIQPHVFNRNPRNLELLRLARKPGGWTLERDFREYFYRLVIERTNKHTTARLEHNSGKTVVSVSTRDWDARQFLGKTNDLSATKILGKMFAARCLMCGFLEFHSSYGQEIRLKSEKINAFITALEESGLCLEEPPVIPAPTREDRKRHEYAWDVLEEDVIKTQNLTSGSSS